MYLDEYLAKPLLSAKICHKNTPTHKPKGPGIDMQYFPNIYIYIVRCAECQVLIKTQKYCRKLNIIIATDPQNLGFIRLPFLKTNKNKIEFTFCATINELVIS